MMKRNWVDMNNDCGIPKSIGLGPQPAEPNRYSALLGTVCAMIFFI